MHVPRVTHVSHVCVHVSPMSLMHVPHVLMHVLPSCISCCSQYMAPMSRIYAPHVSQMTKQTRELECLPAWSPNPQQSRSQLDRSGVVVDGKSHPRVG